jgi:hypothetical protein
MRFAQCSRGPGTSAGVFTILGTAIPIVNLQALLRLDAGRRVINKTDLKGLYDLRLQFMSQMLCAGADRSGLTGLPGTFPDASGPSLVTAIQEQLGLRLESTRGPVEVLVIESVQRHGELTTRCVCSCIVRSLEPSSRQDLRNCNQLLGLCYSVVLAQDNLGDRSSLDIAAAADVTDGVRPRQDPHQIVTLRGDHS